jgi:SPP1 gp7 family putative phage head morphogenesis protein
MGTVNEDIFDRIVAHMANTRMYEEGLQVQNRRILRRHRSNLSKLLRTNIQASTGREVSRFNKEMVNHLTSSVKEFSTAELDFQTTNLHKSVAKYYKAKRPSNKELLAEITGPQIKGVSSIKGNLRNISKGELVRIQTKVKAGLASGTPNDEIIKDVLKTTRLTEVQVRTLTRTSITSTQSAAMSNVIGTNKGLISGYVFTAILDSRTSPICAHHNGRIYAVDDKRFLPPLHWNCRSALIPVVKSKSELSATSSTRVNKKGLDKADPKKLDGKLAPRESFGEWFKRQSYEIQKNILGDDQRVNFYRQGQLRFEKFITAKGKILSIQALRKRATESTTLFKSRQIVRELDSKVNARTPNSLLRNPKHADDLRNLFLLDADDRTKTMSLTDYKGTSLVGKQQSRRRVGNQFDERNFSADPLTGEVKNNLVYDPDTGLFQERLDFMRSSKLLSLDQKDFIENLTVSLEGKISVNQQTVIVDNVRVVMERFARDKVPWENFPKVLRAENRFAVQNVSRMLDVRSRKRSEMFTSYLSSKEGAPQVQIMGKYYDFNQLNKSQLKDQRYIDTWRANEGVALARKIYYKGRSPARVYFRKIIPSLPTSRKPLINRLKKDTKYKALEDAYKATFKREPSDAWITKTYARGRASIRSMLDMEFFNIRNNKKLLPDFDEYAIEELSKIAKIIGSGTTTDYDLLAIKIGQHFSGEIQKKGRDSGFLRFPSFSKSATIADNHREGSKVLQLFEQQGLIKTNFRGKTRRGVMDVDTGRPSGAWADTVSREVTVVNPELRKLQIAERKVTIARRLGVVNPRDRLYVVANKKTYVDARGKDSGIPIISADKFPDYDPKQIDREMATMLNHVMDTEYAVDTEFFDFMDDVVRFRDPRGKSKYYDSINEFRHEILARGEQGYGMMSTAKWHRQRGKNFKTQSFIDSRGRVYHRGYLTPTGGEMVRPFLNSGKAVNFSQDAFTELRIQTGALIGPGTEALTTAGRLEIFRRNEKGILELGRLLQATTQRDRRIREFLEHPLIAVHEGPEVPKMARMALEYARLHDHVKGNFKNTALLNSYKTRLMIENDASASGAQIIALSTKNKQLGTASNVVPTTQKNRLYDLVAMDTVNDPDFLKIKSLRDAGLTWEDLAKGAKAQNMVTFYGAGDATKAANVSAKMAKILDGKGYFTVSKQNLRDQLSLIDSKIKQSVRVGATSVESELKAFRKELVELVNNDTPISARIAKLSAEMHPDTSDFVNKLQNARLGVVGPKDFDEISRIMSRNLSERAPVTDNFIVFWKKVAKTYVKETEKVDIPWVTFDGKTMMQRYRSKLQQRIEFTDPVTGKKVANIYESAAKDGALIGKYSIQDAAIGLGVNGNHSNDAVIVRRFHLWGAKNNIGTGTIHDAFFTNIGHAEAAKQQLRTIYADALDSDTIRDTLKAMRSQGLSKKTYQELLDYARELGLVDSNDPLRRIDIMAPLKEGHDLYGIGP